MSKKRREKLLEYFRQDGEFDHREHIRRHKELIEQRKKDIKERKERKRDGG